MIKYFTTLQNERGDVLPSYRAQVTDSAGSVVTIYADKGGTRFTDASGNNVNYATADEKGRISFYFTPAVGQTLQTLDVAGNLQDGEADFADSMVLDTLPGEIAQSAVTDLTTDLAAKAATADLASTTSGKGVELVAGAAKSIATRAAMKALTSAADKARPLHLTESGREGVFVWDATDRSADVTDDTQEGIFIAPDSDATGASGAWVRQHGGVVQSDWFGAKGDNVTDDTTALQAASTYTSTLLSGIERATLALRPGGQYRISSTITVTGHSIAGNGAALYSSTAITMLHIKASNQSFDNLYLRFSALQSSSSAIGVKLSENAVGQASKNTFINVQTRFAYNGFYTLGGSAANGSIFGTTFINCRALKGYDYGWNLSCSTGTTTLSFINCQAEADAASPQGKGFYISDSTEVCLYNCAADLMADGQALEVRNALSVIIDTFAAESCTLASANSKLVNFAGNADIRFDLLKVKVPDVDVGAGNTGFYVYFSSGQRAYVGNIVANSETITSGSLKKLRTTAVQVQSDWINLDDVETGGFYNVFSGGDALGYSTNYGGLPTAGTTRRVVWNRLPSFGEAAFWVDDGTAYRAVGPLLDNQTTAQLTNISAAVNTTAKFAGKPVYNTTTSEVVYATGSAAGDNWVAYDNSATHTPV